MGDEGAIYGHQAQIFDHALSKQKAIEGISRGRLWFRDRQHVTVIDHQERNSDVLHKVRKQTSEIG